MNGNIGSSERNAKLLTSCEDGFIKQIQTMQHPMAQGNLCPAEARCCQEWLGAEATTIQKNSIPDETHGHDRQTLILLSLELYLDSIRVQSPNLMKDCLRTISSKSSLSRRTQKDTKCAGHEIL